MIEASRHGEVSEDTFMMEVYMEHCIQMHLTCTQSVVALATHASRLLH